LGTPYTDRYWWPAHHVDLYPEDIVKDLYARFNVVTIPLQSLDSFHTDICEQATEEERGGVSSMMLMVSAASLAITIATQAYASALQNVSGTAPILPPSVSPSDSLQNTRTTTKRSSSPAKNRVQARLANIETEPPWREGRDALFSGLLPSSPARALLRDLERINNRYGVVPLAVADTVLEMSRKKEKALCV
jgi:hypothetical protein